MKISQDQFYKIFIESPSAMGISTFKESRLIEVNDSFLEFVGYKREDVIGRTSYDLDLWVDKNIRSKVVNNLPKNGLVHNMQTKIRTKAGKIKDILCCLRRILIGNDKQSVILFMFQDVTILKDSEKALIASQKELKEKKIALEEKNAVLREVISLVEEEKDKVRKDVAANIDLLIPIIEKIKIKEGSQKYSLDLIKNGLENIVSSFGKVISQKSLRLTSREIEICNMIKNGLTTKEIAKTCNISPQTIEKHRKNIRKKMGLSLTSVNLTTFLKSI